MVSNTFNIADIHNVLKLNESFLYHGVGNGMGSGADVSLHPIAHLKNALTSNYELCCSTVLKQDSRFNNNYFGEFGFILKLKHVDSVTYVCPNDAGSSKNANGRRHTTHGVSQPIGIIDIKNSISNRGITIGNIEGTAWNEWGITDYDIFGIYVDACSGLPFQFFINDKIVELNLNDIANAFPNLSIYSKDSHNQLCLVSYCAVHQINWGKIFPISNIYP